MNIVAKFMSVWLHPWSSMQTVKEEGEDAGIVSSMIFILVMAIISGLLTGVIGMINPPANPTGIGILGKGAVWVAAGLIPVFSFLGSFVGAFLIWGLVDGLLKSTTSQYKVAYRILGLLAAFSPISAMLAGIPKVGQYLAILINVWATMVMIRGIIIVRDTRPLRTWVTCGVLFALLLVLGIAARFATERQLRNPASDLGGFGTGTKGFGNEDFGYEPSDLDKELEDLANKEKSQTKPDSKPETKEETNR